MYRALAQHRSSGEAAAMRSRPWMFAIATGAAVLTGCVEKRKPAESASPARSPAAPAQPPPAKPAEKKVEPVKPPEQKVEPAAKPADASLGGYLQNLSNAEKTAAKTADLAGLNKTVRQFEAMEGRLPQSLEELVTKKYLPSLPAPPRGQRLVYDPVTGAVTVAPLP